MFRAVGCLIFLVWVTGSNVLGQGRADLPASPSGVILGEYYASDNSTYYFCPDGKAVLDYGMNARSQMLGTWRMAGDTVYFHFTRRVWERGVGATLPLAGNEEIYEEYVLSITYTDENDYFVWSEILQLLKDDPNYPFELKAPFADCSEFNFDEELPGRFAYASSRPLSYSDLENLAPGTLRLMRNEIFARYGYIFKSQDLRTHFESTSWYEPRFKDVEEYLSELEKQNIKFIREYE